MYCAGHLVHITHGIMFRVSIGRSEAPTTVSVSRAVAPSHMAITTVSTPAMTPITTGGALVSVLERNSAPKPIDGGSGICVSLVVISQLHAHSSTRGNK